LKARSIAACVLLCVAQGAATAGCSDLPHMRARRVVYPPHPTAQRMFATNDTRLVLQASAWTLSEFGIVTMLIDSAEGTLHANNLHGFGAAYGVKVEPAGDAWVLVTFQSDSPYSPEHRAPGYYATFFDALGRQLRLTPEPVAEAEPAPEVVEPAGD